MTSGSRRRASGGQEGATLVETLVALFLIGVLIAALVQGLLTSTTATDTTNRAQRLDAAITSMGETLKQLRYVPRASANDYDTAYNQKVKYDDSGNERTAADRAERFGVPYVAVWPSPSGFRVTQVQCWFRGEFSKSSPTVPGQFIDSCATDGGAQLVTYSVTLGGMTRTGQVVKRETQPLRVP